MKSTVYAVVSLLCAVTLACGISSPAVIPTPEHSVFDSGRTAYGFFPSPPEVSLQSIQDTIQAIGNHGDVILIQQNIPWEDFLSSAEAESQTITDIRNMGYLASQSNLELIFVVDPLNGLNRREFYELPAGWNPSFGTPEVRAAFTHFALRIVREFHPRYLGLASEINTYADTHPDDFPKYVSLYSAVYEMVKAESPETQVFVTFQWEELNNLFFEVANGRQPYEINWDQVEVFEPRLDVWAISSYPFIIFPEGDEIPSGYYSPLLERTDKPLAVAEGGYSSRDVGPFHGTPEGQAAYLNAIYDQIGSRLVFWIYLLLTDLNLDSYAQMMDQTGHEQDIGTLGMFAWVGLRELNGSPKPALGIWDSYRSNP